jgi:hypothetical protein
MSLTAQLHERPYLLQWARVGRWWERARSVQGHAEPHTGFDFEYALFGSIFDMRDWIAASRPDLKAAVHTLFGDPDLALVRDVTNGAKHLTLTRYGAVGEATLLREYLGDGNARLVVPIPGGGNVDALELARRATDKIRAFMEAHDLLTG